VFDVIGKRRWFFLISGLLTLPGLVFILLTPFGGGDLGLRFTIDYTGGTRWVIRFADPLVPAADVREVLEREGLESTVVKTSTGFHEIKTIPLGLVNPTPPPTPIPTVTPAPSGSAGPSGSAAPPGSAAPSASVTPAPSGSAAPSGSPAPSSSVAPSGSAAAGASASPVPSASVPPSASPSPSASPVPSASPNPSPTPPPQNTNLPTEGRLGEMVVALEDEFGEIAEQQSLTTIGAIVSNDLVNQALLLIAIGSLGILGWITYRFRDVKFGLTALVALLHDVVLVVGAFAILGTFFGVEVDALFVTAMLTVIGFSVHDTIVVFDRVRENKARHAGEPFPEIVNHSVLQTMGRSITTSFTVVITLLALLLFGGSATTYFVLALLIGIVAGTYSSVFFAAPLLVEWYQYEDRRHGRTPVTRAPRRATP
jgi:preprotein translocase SecF subunit